MKIGQREAIQIQEVVDKLARDIYGKRVAFVVIFQDEDLSLDVATNTRPADLPNLSHLIREAADMVAGGQDAVQKFFEDPPANTPN